MTTTTTEPSATIDEPIVETAPQVDSATELEALREKAAKLEALEAEFAKARQEAAEKFQRQQEEAVKNGEFKTAYEAQSQKLKELEQLAPLAEKYRAIEKAELAKIEEQAKSLPEAFKKLYSGAVDLEAKRDVLAAYAALPTTVAPKDVLQAPATGAPPSQSSVDFAEAMQKGEKEFSEAKARDPKGFANWMANLFGTNKQSPIGIARFARK